MEDSGMFQCLAANEAGEDSIYTWLKVKSMYSFVLLNFLNFCKDLETDTVQDLFFEAYRIIEL